MNIKFNKDIFILGIESSCDDTSIGVSKNMSVLSNIVSSQKIHKKYGGVVPELALREHQKNIIPTLQEALKSSKNFFMKLTQLLSPMVQVFLVHFWLEHHLLKV